MRYATRLVACVRALSSVVPTVRVLLVEDERLIAVATARGLRQRGIEVVCAFSAAEAIKVVRADQRIACLVMDVNLGPGEDGVVTAQRIIATKEVPVVFVSGHHRKELSERIASFGRRAVVLSKWCGTERLAEEIFSLLSPGE